MFRMNRIEDRALFYVVKHCHRGIMNSETAYNGKESRAGNTTLSAIAAFKGGGLKGLSIEIGPLPLTRAVYFFLWKDRINTTRVANEIISVNAWYTSTGITSLQGRLADRPYKPIYCFCDYKMDGKF